MNGSCVLSCWYCLLFLTPSYQSLLPNLRLNYMQWLVPSPVKSASCAGFTIYGCWKICWPDRFLQSCVPCKAFEKVQLGRRCQFSGNIRCSPLAHTCSILQFSQCTCKITDWPHLFHQKLVPGGLLAPWKPLSPTPTGKDINWVGPWQILFETVPYIGSL